ncbi:unnamed protein product [Ambrosiozyma monospora]|uniref:Unnamed protein product n=1 Tax=Ambrosiozyma monospora TaxID=43982 RepID=A0ACB5UAW4_AMBMO|nr:unnamed protein product [Ambrosiozyma monospora]
MRRSTKNFPKSSLASHKKLNQAFKDKLNERVKSSPEVASTTSSSPATTTGSKNKKKKNKKKKEQQPAEVSASNEADEENTKETETVDDHSDDGDTIELKHNYEILQEKVKKLENVQSEVEDLKEEHSKLQKELDLQKTASKSELESSNATAKI